jgi:hypothetical protein
MPKRKKSAGKPNKSAFVRSLSFDTPSAEVIAKAKAKGMTLTRNDVHAIRAIARRKQTPGKGGASRAVRRSGGVNKSAFVRSLPGSLSAAEVIRRAKDKNIKLSAAQVYTIRANARRKADEGGSPVGIKKYSGGRASAGGGSASESAFLQMALELGLVRAEGILGSLRDRAAVGLG